jgi:hypothetical protein
MEKSLECLVDGRRYERSFAEIHVKEKVRAINRSVL